MFTIKAVYAPNHEEIFEAKRVWTMPIVNSAHCNVMFIREDNDVEMGICTENCYVYVMNDKGRTVANYS